MSGRHFVAGRDRPSCRGRQGPHAAAARPRTLGGLHDKFPWDLADPAARATGISRTGSRSFSGTVPAGESSLQVCSDLQPPLTSTIRAASPESASSPPAQKVLYAFSDFGANVDITAPPPGEVVEEDNPSFLSSLPLL